MLKMNSTQLRNLLKQVGRIGKSDEQFIFMIFKNEDGTDHITEYAYNMMPKKIIYYWEKALEHAKSEREKNGR